MRDTGRCQRSWNIAGVVLALGASRLLAGEPESLGSLPPVPDLSAVAMTLARFLVLVVGCAVCFVFAVRYLARRRSLLQGGKPRGLIEVLRAQRLDARRQVYLLRVGAAAVLVAGGDGALTALVLPPDALPAEESPDAVAPPKADQPSFLSILRRAPLASGA